MIGVIVLGLVAGGYVLIGRERARPTVAANTNTSLDNPTSDLFTELFLLAYRSDQGRGNVAIGAVYYFPALQGALNAFTQPSEHQREVSTELANNGANASTFGVYLMVDSVVAQTTLDFSRGVTLTDGLGHVYSIDHWQQLSTALPQSTNQVRTASLLFFKRTADDGTLFPGDDAKTLTLTIKDVGDQPTREFVWNLRVLPQS